MGKKAERTFLFGGGQEEVAMETLLESNLVVSSASQQRSLKALNKFMSQSCLGVGIGSPPPPANGDEDKISPAAPE